MNQAITNILKNAGEAIEARKLKSESLEEKGVINVMIEENAGVS